MEIMVVMETMVVAMEMMVVMETTVVVMLSWKQDLPARMKVMRHVSFGR